MTASRTDEIRSTCPYCGVGCGVLLRPDAHGGLSVRGDPDHPANHARLCSKGLALAETVGLSHRLTAPQIEKQSSTWDEALSLVARRFSETIAEHGPDSVAFYVSGQLLTEDYYIANKLMKGFIGSANIDTNSRLCMASTVAGHKRAFGTDTVPQTYEDLEEADLVVLVGSNLAWCHPVLYQRLIHARKRRGTKLVVIDPRRTATCDDADLHLAIAPGADVPLFNRLLAVLHDRGLADKAFLRNTQGYEDALAAARQDDPAVTGLSELQIAQFCDLWASTEKVVTVFSQGVNQSTSGADKVNAILNCHLATGRIGKRGCGPLSVTGQPNAMGGREVGGLANMLACHMDIENPRHRRAVGDFWSAPTMPAHAGLKAVDMFRAVGQGQIKALWIIHTNPAVSMPDAASVRAAIASCPFTVVSDITDATDTARLADVLLPASAWGEKEGTVTNSDRTISRQRVALPAPEGTRPDWAILAEVGRRMGWETEFDYGSAAEIFREYAALSGIAGEFGLDFDISGLSGLSDLDYADLAPTRWPVCRAKQGGRFFSDGRFFHTDHKARFVPVSYRRPAAKTGPRYPFRLNTGRVRDQWHTMTRTGLSPRLSAHLAEPFIEIHPHDADRLNIGPAGLVRVESPIGQAILRARITDTVQCGQVFAPMHWTGETAPAARIDDLIAPACDPVSGQPESKASVVRLEPFAAKWYGFAVSADPMQPSCDYWARVPSRMGFRAELAGTSDIADWEAEALRLFGLKDASVSSIIDPARGIARIALFKGGRLQAALFVAATPVAVARDYLATLPEYAGSDVLSGRVPVDVPDPGPNLCACFGVGVNTIVDAIQTQHLYSVDAIGAALLAGTNCGSCRPEIAALIQMRRPQEAAE